METITQTNITPDSGYMKKLSDEALDYLINGFPGVRKNEWKGLPIKFTLKIYG